MNRRQQHTALWHRRALPPTVILSFCPLARLAIRPVANPLQKHTATGLIACPNAVCCCRLSNYLFATQFRFPSHTFFFSFFRLNSADFFTNCFILCSRGNFYITDIFKFCFSIDLIAKTNVFFQ